MKKAKKFWSIRYIVQAVFFILILLISVNHTLSEEGKAVAFLPAASIHAVCPFGGVETLYQFVTDGSFIKKIHLAALVLMTLVAFLAVGFGAVFCGWVCPLGSVQEWFGKIGRKVFGKRYNNFIPYKYDKYIRFLRYGVLAWVLYMTAISGDIIFSEIDPYAALFHLWSSEIALGGLIVLAITLLLSLLIERPWCKYLCPYGAVLGLSNLFRIFKIRRKESSCIACGTCDRSCPMNIKVSKASVVRDHQCISCMKCTSEDACPVANTVELSIRGGKKIEG